MKKVAIDSIDLDPSTEEDLCVGTLKNWIGGKLGLTFPNRYGRIQARY